MTVGISASFFEKKEAKKLLFTLGGAGVALEATYDKIFFGAFF